MKDVEAYLEIINNSPSIERKNELINILKHNPVLVLSLFFSNEINNIKPYLNVLLTDIECALCFLTQNMIYIDLLKNKPGWKEIIEKKDWVEFNNKNLYYANIHKINKFKKKHPNWALIPV